MPTAIFGGKGLSLRGYGHTPLPACKWSMVIASLVLFPLVVLPIYLWATDPYPSILPRIRYLAQSVGGWVSNHVSRKDALTIAGQHRAILEDWGLVLPADSKGLRNAVASAEEILTDFANRNGC